MYERFTCDEHFELFGRAYGLNEQTERASRARIYTQLGFERHATARADRLSGGTLSKRNLGLALLARRRPRFPPRVSITVLRQPDSDSPGDARTQGRAPRPRTLLSGEERIGGARGMRNPARTSRTVTRLHPRRRVGDTGRAYSCIVAAP